MIPVKVNYNYFTLYKASIRLSSVPHIYTTKSWFEVVRYDEKWFHFLLLKWMDENWSFFLIYKSCPVKYKSRQRQSKINYYSSFLSRGTSRLIKWIYKERYELLYLLKRNNNLITARKPLSWNLCHVTPPAIMEFLMSAEHLFQSIWK